MLVEIYGKTGCVYCEQAKFLCQMKGIEFEYLQLGENYEFNELEDRVGSPFRTFPQIFVNGDHVGGYVDLVEKLK